MQRRGLRHVLQHQVVLHGAVVDADVDAELAGQLAQALLLAGERRAAVPVGHEQRLDAERVAGAEQHPLLGVPDQEGEHAAQPGDRVGPQ